MAHRKKLHRLISECTGEFALNKLNYYKEKKRKKTPGFSYIDPIP